jgi:asparagine synthase (glutamine-hydrolysing)
MSGIAAVIGNSNIAECKKMLTCISHRGPDINGFAEIGAAVIGQNYLPADVNAVYEKQTVPNVAHRPSLRTIGYDGQIGNRTELARRFGIEGDAFLEERLLLDLYHRHGPEMFSHLQDAIFAFVIVDEQHGLFAARDLLGIKTLFYTVKNGVTYLASEIKAILAVTSDVYEFPAGHYMTHDGEFIAFADLPEQPPECLHSDETQSIAFIRSAIETSLDNRIDFKFNTGSLLSGGIDSSVIAMLASRRYKARFGSNAQLNTFALGVGESEDIINARLVAKAIDSRHHEKIVDLDKLLAVLDDVIYHLESFDPSLVRSAASNYLISQFAAQQGIEVLLSGEGGDEVFCGYLYLKDEPPEALFNGQINCLKFLHNNASLRLDHMNQCHQVRVVAPLISGPLLNFTLALAPELKQKPDGDLKMEKYIFRKTFEKDLPTQVVWRLKQEFSQGSGSAARLPAYFEQTITDNELIEIQQAFPMVRSKEEMFYFKLFTKHFGSGSAVDTVGQWITL